MYSVISLRAAAPHAHSSAPTSHIRCCCRALSLQVVVSEGQKNAMNALQKDLHELNERAA